jgi:hypothetical protein
MARNFGFAAFPPLRRAAGCEVRGSPQQDSLFGQDWAFGCLCWLMGERIACWFDRNPSRQGDCRMLINSLPKAGYNGACGV